ncbi:hypothetical protein FQN50_003940 [Emmonsiellopsis sp. PD_5]|nr:hypothetical protein FQN50_003940 [Emmonsiellopsis sp. PD_5]
MGDPIVNGEVPSSQFIKHLTSIPLISDSLAAIQNNSYAQKSIQLADQSYSHLAKPVVPILAKPYTYLAPYVAKVDSLGNEGLNRVEVHFPIVKKDTEAIKGTIKGYIYLPARIAGDGKQHLMDVYSNEYKSCGGEGYVALGKAVITTGLTLTSESLLWLGSVIGSKKEAVEAAVPEGEKKKS